MTPPARAHSRVSCVAAAGPVLALAGCTRGPPPSQFPNAREALERNARDYACSRGVQAEAKLDYFGERGRVRGNVLYMTLSPERSASTFFTRSA